MATVHIYLNNVFQKEVPLFAGDTTIGRTDKNDIVLDNIGVSSRHAKIINQDDCYYITDMGSTNGTIVNGEKITRQQSLEHDDDIMIGNKHHLKFIASSIDYSSRSRQRDPEPVEDQLTGNETMMLNPAQMKQILHDKSMAAMVREGNATAKLLVDNLSSGDSNTLKLDKTPVVIGTGKGAKIKVSGWFVPKIVAVINFRQDSYFLIPHKMGKIKMQDVSITSPKKLTHLDKFTIYNLEIKFTLTINKT